MRKYFTVTAILFLILSPVAGFTVDATFPAMQPANESIFWTMGYPITCAPVYVDNVARTVQALIERAGCAWQVGDAATGRTLTPIGIMVSCDSKDTRWAAGMTPTPTAGHKISADGSFRFPGSGWALTGKAIAVGATDNVSCALTREY